MSYKIFGVPPSRANPTITLPLNTAQDVVKKMQSLRVGASQLVPINWAKLVKLCSPQNQRSCGNCWIVSSSCVLADRFIIKKHLANLVLNYVLGTQCVPDVLNNGCGGGQPISAGKYFETTGLAPVSDSCPDFDTLCNTIDCTNPNNLKLPTCDQIVSQCMASKPIIYKAVSGSTRTLAASTPELTITNLKTELLNGPFVSCFQVNVDFEISGAGYTWAPTNNIYISGAYGTDPAISKYSSMIPNGGSLTSSMGFHAVETVGWDIGDAGSKYGKIPYWIVKNSWGTDWNNGGYFKIAMTDASKGINNTIGFDVPITVQGQSFGSGTAFDPDLNTGAPDGHVYKSLSASSTSKNIFWIILGIIVILGLTWAFWKFSKKKGKKKA